MKNLLKYLNSKDDIPKLKRFANVGTAHDFNKKLDYLRRHAEPEKWDQTDLHSKYKNSTLFYYIIHTFDRVFEQGKIYVDESEENAFFNTGLMDVQGNEFLGQFEKNNLYDGDIEKYNYWHFKGFVKSNQREFIKICNEKPNIATYYTNYNEVYFDPSLPIELNFNHFYDDNLERLPEELSILDRETARMVFTGFLEFTKKKIKRNDRIAVPQFYNGKIMFLIPVVLFKKKTMVIALEKINNVYVANTVLTMGMAYNCARLLNKPESNWLLN